MPAMANVFEDSPATAKRGALYIDNVRFTADPR